MKKTTKIITALLIFTAALFTSCSNDDGNEESFGTTTGNFLPLAVNNNWIYFDAEQSLLSDIDIVGKSTFGGKTYYEFTDDGDGMDTQQWFAKKGATYILKVGETTFIESGFTGTIGSYELPILKDDFAINDTWSGSISPKFSVSGAGQTQNLPLEVNYVGKNFFIGELTLDGITYPNVIKSKMELTVIANGQTTNTTEEYWFAEDVGIINFITTNLDSSVTAKTIQSYLLN